MTSSKAKKRKLIEFDETDDPATDIYNGLDLISKGMALAVSGFTRINSETQDELTSLAMIRKECCIEEVNRYHDEIKQVIEQDLQEITELLDESRLRSGEMKLDDLHEDILLVLFDYLPLEDILQLRLLSVRMHNIITSLLSKRVRWNICLYEYEIFNHRYYPKHYMLSTSHFSTATPLHLHLKENLNFENMEDLKNNYHRFQFSSLIGEKYGTFENLPEDVCKDLNSVESLIVKKGLGKQASLIINASSNTIETMSLDNVTLYPEIIQNDLNQLQHLKLDFMKSDDFHILLKKCRKSFNHLSLHKVSLNDDAFMNLQLVMDKLETLNISWSPEIETKLPFLLTKCSTTLKSLTLKNGCYSSLANLEVEMLSLDKILISGGRDSSGGLVHLLNLSPNLQHLEIEDVNSSRHTVIFKENNVKRLTLNMNHEWDSSYDLEENLLKASRNNLQELDITFACKDHSRCLFLATNSVWFLPKLKKMTVRGRYDKAIKKRRNLANHMPPEVEVQYFRSSSEFDYW